VSDTIEVSLPGDHVRKIGGNKAFEEMMELANSESSAQGKQLDSLVTVRLDKETDTYFAVFTLR
jgi:hypothetical protein